MNAREGQVDSPPDQTSMQSTFIHTVHGISFIFMRTNWSFYQALTEMLTDHIEMLNTETAALWAL